MKHFQKFLLFLTALLFVTTAQAKSIQDANINTPGFYMGVENGASFASYSNTIAPGFVANKVEAVGFATRVFGGFDITHYFGTEFGVVYFHKPHLININSGESAKVKNNLVFLVAKGIYPFNRRLAAYLNLGFGYVVRSGVIISNTEVLADKEIIRPMYGLGLAYLIWTRWSASITWLGAAKLNRVNLPYSNYIGIGIRYKFAS